MDLQEVEDVLVPWIGITIGLAGLLIPITVAIAVHDFRRRRFRKRKEALADIVAYAIEESARFRAMALTPEERELKDAVTGSIEIVKVTDKRRRTYGFPETDLEPDIGMLPEPDPIVVD